MGNALQRRRMGMAQEDIERMRCQIAQIVRRELLQGRNHGVGIGRLCSELIGFELVSTLLHVQQNAENPLDRRVEQTKENQDPFVCL